jgi:hypothetical protein
MNEEMLKKSCDKLNKQKRTSLSEDLSTEDYEKEELNHHDNHSITFAPITDQLRH